MTSGIFRNIQALLLTRFPSEPLSLTSRLIPNDPNTDMDTYSTHDDTRKNGETSTRCTACPSLGQNVLHPTNKGSVALFQTTLEQNSSPQWTWTQWLDWLQTMHDIHWHICYIYNHIYSSYISYNHKSYSSFQNWSDLCKAVLLGLFQQIAQAPDRLQLQFIHCENSRSWHSWHDMNGPPCTAQHLSIGCTLQDLIKRDQTWLSGKSPINGGFNGKIIY